MEAPKIPADETARIEALYTTDLLDTPREPMFDNLTELVADIFNVPIVAISLVDKSRQWFKSIQGIDVCETSREVSFCGHVVHDKKPLVVENALADKRFFDNPLVEDGPKIKFYAGTPVYYQYEGQSHIIGTLCIIDYTARTFSSKDLQRLKAFAYEVELLISMRMTIEKAEAANLAKSSFLANMSHELRTPMSGVIGILEILKHSSITQEQRQQLELASKSAGQLLSVINDILDFSKIEAGKVELQNSVFDPKQLITDLIETYNVRSNDDKRFHFNCGWKAPLHVTGDPMRLRQILFNLLNNADKFTAQGEITVTADIHHHDEEQLLFDCKVIDEGIGMQPEVLTRLFTAFEQGDSSTTRRYGGTGLGLTICRKLCVLMGGEIEVESEYGIGTTFSFHIRLKTARRKSVETKSLARSELTQQGLRTLKVLVVEDDLTNRVTLEFLLNHLGVAYDSAVNGRRALECLQDNDEKPYDLILMDCQMPEMDGYELSRLIRRAEVTSIYQSVPIIALTANALEGDREKCLSVGMSDYMPKPVDINTLTAKLIQWGLRPEVPEF